MVYAFQILTLLLTIVFTLGAIAEDDWKVKIQYLAFSAINIFGLIYTL